MFTVNRWGLWPIRVGAFGTNATMSISSIFSGAPGFWLDAGDLSTLYQEAAGTTPVAAHTDPVGLWVDKSGNGNDFSQATSTKRPLYDTSIFPALKFDNVDDFLTKASLDMSGTHVQTLVVGYYYPANDATNILHEQAAGAGRVYLATKDSPASIQNTSVGLTLSISTSTAGCAEHTLPATVVFRATLDSTDGADRTTKIRVWLNGESITPTYAGVVDPGTGDFVVGNAYIGARAGTSLFSNAYIGFLAAVGRELTEEERTWIEAQAALTCGVTL
jgi:hypothetical protein